MRNNTIAPEEYEEEVMSDFEASEIEPSDTDIAGLESEAEEVETDALADYSDSDNDDVDSYTSPLLQRRVSAMYDDDETEAEAMLYEEDFSSADDHYAGNEGSKKDADPALDSVKLYLQEIGEYKLLSTEEVAGLSIRIQKGIYADYLLSGSVGKDIASLDDKDKAEVSAADDNSRRRLSADGKEAQNTLVSHNLRLAFNFAKRYRNHGLAFEDLYSEANLGLMKAAEKFDYRKGFKFSTYAVWWIKDAIKRAIQNSGRSIRIPVHNYEFIGKMKNVENGFIQEFGREPTIDEIAERMGIKPDRVREIKEYSQDITSLDTPVGEEDDGSSTLGDYVEDKHTPSPVQQCEWSQRTTTMIKAMNLALDKTEKQVMCMIYGLDGSEPMTAGDIADKLGVSDSRVGQIKTKALKKMRFPFPEENTE